MKQINIKDLVNYSFRSINMLIVEDEELEYELTVPRRRMNKKNQFETTYDYHYAGAIGQKLFNVSNYFTYYVPCHYSSDPFIFHFVLKNKEGFSELIIWILSVLFKKTDDLIEADVFGCEIALKHSFEQPAAYVGYFARFCYLIGFYERKSMPE